MAAPLMPSTVRSCSPSSHALATSSTAASWKAIVTRAVRRVPHQPQPGPGVYRGWMVTPEQYRLLYEALEDKGIRLLNDPAAYRHCHYLPESYPVIEPHTPRSVWIKMKGDIVLAEELAGYTPHLPLPQILPRPG